MARIRSIKPDFWTSEQVMECSANARLLFIGMWNFADDCGRLLLAPKTIKAQIFPGDNITSEIILGMVSELLKNGLLLKYEVDGKEFLQVTGWQHQRIDKPQPSKFPAPRNGFSKSIPGIVATEGIGGEGIVEEGKGKENNIKSKQASARAFVDDPKAEQSDVTLHVHVLKTDLMDAFGEKRCPDLTRASGWIAKGYAPSMIIEVVRELLGRKPDIASLAYFDDALAKRHASRAELPSERAAAEKAFSIEDAVKSFVRTGKWSRYAGPEPGQAGCKASVELLASYGLDGHGQKIRKAG